MTGFKIDYEVIDPSVTEQTIIEARFSHLFDGKFPLFYLLNNEIKRVFSLYHES